MMQQGAVILLCWLSELSGFVLNGKVSSSFVYLIQNQDLPKNRNSNEHMELEWELCKIYVVCEIKHSERFTVFCSLGNWSVFLEGVMEACKIFKHKDNASIPPIE